MKHQYFEVDSAEPSYFGVVNQRYNHALMDEDIAKIVTKGREISRGGGWPQRGECENSFVKKLKAPETKVLPCKRFQNANILHQLSTSMRNKDIPAPYGLIYAGTPQKIMLGEEQNAYYVAEFIPGPSLCEVIRNLSKKERQKVSVKIGLSLRNWNSQGAYLIDFAPRDIVLRQGNAEKPYFVDTEHMEVVNSKTREQLLQEQEAQFKKDYEELLSAEEINGALRIIKS